jgi:acyl-CoA reductase-like NAD-dependent aldehyde dehydrogenase
MVEKRIDPEDKMAYSYEEMAAFYKGKYKKAVIDEYWAECKPEKGKGKGKGKSTGKTNGKEKSKPKAKAAPTEPKMSKEPPLYKMLVNGELVESGKTFGVINPSTGEVFAYAPECSKKILNEAVKSAKEAFVTWKDTPAKERKACLEKAIEKTKEALPEIKEILVKEQGKPTGGADFELGGVLAFLGGFLQMEVEDKVLVDNDAEKIIEKRLPLGVIGGICPWNFPVLMAAWKIGEAVVTGNTIVVKSSPYTPLSTLAWAKAVVDCFPKGVLNLVSGSNAVGEMLVLHKDIQKISFTGSIATGKKIQEAAASTLKHVTLELGGNDAAIVLPDADVKKSAQGIYAMSMVNSGQVCIAVKRCYVHEKIHDEFVEELAEQAKKAVVGDGFKEGVEFGPINNKMQFDKVCKLVANAKKKPGAKVHAGGEKLPGKGYFFPPTIISGLGENVPLVKEEQFGPVLPVLKYSEIDDALKRANSTLYGLGGSVWGPTEEATALAAKIEAGTVWVNQHANLSPDVPFGGLKESGIGRQMGPATVDYYTEAKIVRIVKDAK